MKVAAARSSEALWRTARRLRPRRRFGKAPPRLIFFTDPLRTPDPAAVIARLPRGAGVVYRAFGAAGALAEGRRLARAARSRGVVFLVGADPALASRLMADGVHLPERLAMRAVGLRRQRPGWLVTCAAHSLAAIVQARRAGAHAVIVSPVFPSRSPSAGRPLGAIRFAALAGAAGLPVVALGGIRSDTAPQLLASGAAGLAVVEGLLG